MTSDIDALIAHARTVCTAHEWLHDLSNLERQMIAQTAANLAGTTALEPDTVVVRQVYNALLSPPVDLLLGVGTCPACDEEMRDDDCINPRCEMNRPLAPTGRDHRGWLRRPY